jgi:hypothetical protein
MTNPGATDRRNEGGGTGVVSHALFLRPLRRESSAENQVDQSPVLDLSEERRVDYRLLDAEVWLELCAKKYKTAHQKYLAAVRGGKEMPRPVVYETGGSSQAETQPLNRAEKLAA